MKGCPLRGGDRSARLLNSRAGLGASMKGRPVRAATVGGGRVEIAGRGASMKGRPSGAATTTALTGAYGGYLPR